MSYSRVAMTNILQSCNYCYQTRNPAIFPVNMKTHSPIEKECQQQEGRLASAADFKWVQ